MVYYVGKTKTIGGIATGHRVQRPLALKASEAFLVKNYPSVSVCDDFGDLNLVEAVLLGEHSLGVENLPSAPGRGEDDSEDGDYGKDCDDDDYQDHDDHEDHVEADALWARIMSSF